MDRSPGFGSYTCNSRAFHTRFPYGSAPQALNLAAYINSPDHSTKGTISRFNALYVLVNIRFQVLFHSRSRVLFTFPSQYCFSIGHQVVFRLGGWSPRLPCGFLVSAGTLDPGRSCRLRLRDSHSLRSAFPCCSARFQDTFPGPYPGRIATAGLASSAFARHYSRNLV